MDHPWHIDELDLAAYLDRVGLPEREPDRESLDELHEAHVRAFTFDNIDVLLRQHQGVELAAVQAKFVGRGRGGYCFEHATLFAAVLERLGYDVQRHLGRVGAATEAPRTHCVVEISLDGERLLADPGFGMSLMRPISLEDGAEDDHRGWRHQVRRADPGEVGPGWELHRLRESGWELMHTTDELPVHPVDVLMGHHFTSTYPSTHFLHGLMLARHGVDRHTTVTHETVTIRRPGQPTEHRDLREGELEELLHELGVPLSADEEVRLLDVVAGLRPRLADPRAARTPPHPG
ncbi:arylamine N-acetyltransferase family protein [Aeromicrobium sp.]|uniref:arylamine N-acetyltransferase family protein n=1 Tax=Aeromicrobium sp. TaxID=1871063 RepID=UPI003D6BDFEA